MGTSGVVWKSATVPLATTTAVQDIAASLLGNSAARKKANVAKRREVAVDPSAEGRDESAQGLGAILKLVDHALDGLARVSAGEEIIRH